MNNLLRIFWWHVRSFHRVSIYVHSVAHYSARACAMIPFTGSRAGMYRADGSPSPLSGAGSHIWIPKYDVSGSGVLWYMSVPGYRVYVTKYDVSGSPACDLSPGLPWLWYDVLCDGDVRRYEIFWSMMCCGAKGRSGDHVPVPYAWFWYASFVFQK